MGHKSQRLSAETIDSIQRLALEGFSIERISSMLTLSKSTIYYHAKRFCRKQTRLDLNALTLKEKGYLIGVFVGDGNIIWKPRKGQYGMKITLDKANDQDVAEYVCSLIVGAGKRSLKQIEGNSLILRIFSRKLLEFILSYVLVKKRPGSKRNAKSLIGCENWDSDFRIGFISGAIDSDGHVYHKRGGKHYGAVIKTSDQSLGDQMCFILKRQGLDAYIRSHQFEGTYQTTALCYDVYIPSRELFKLCRDLISVKHSRYH